MAKKTQPVNISVNEKGLASVLVDGVDISQRVLSYTINQDSTNPPQVIIEYACYDQMTFDGEAEVVHVCPKKAR